ncbi:MAG TPA: UvrD-helicase domain-containing protein [Longimicrobiales bacterium]|nr:UvrD-helicase domain-containing protein [Longimicrobiales bacterium]
MTDQLSLFGLPAADSPGKREGERPAVHARAAQALPDAEARQRIRTDLTTNLLVEAGAGAGKTTEMVQRMVALVRTGTAQVHQLAAVTFTRKAAAELRERFQTALERELRVAIDDGDLNTAARIDAALREIDRAFLGTIHAFCARLLRERPLDAGLDPGFRETLGAEEVRLRRQFWNLHLERLAADGDDELAGLNDVGLAPQQLFRLFEELVGQPDVQYPAPEADRPNATFIRRRIEELMDRAVSHMPAEEPRDGWDRLQTSLRMLRFHRFVLGWKRDARFLDILAELRPSSFKATRKRWRDGDAAKELERELAALFEDGGAVNALLRQWWAFRYPVALSFARHAAQAYEQERIRAGTLNFQDLLMFAARLLRDSPPARRELSDRYRFLLVDEFQDTDPIQAEVLFLLASDEELDIFEHSPAIDTTDWRPPFASWRHLTPRAGALFVVGDPKQSIYRFRRADMMLYQQVKRRFEQWGESSGRGGVVELTANFRSRKPIEVFVNSIFEQRFPDESSDVQARFAPMRVQARSGGESVGQSQAHSNTDVQGGEPGDSGGSSHSQPAAHAHGGGGAEGVFWYELDDPVNSRVPQLARQDSERVATYIAERVAAGERRPGDFLLLTPNTKWLAKYASALEQRNIPVQVTGAGVGGPDGVELQELRLLLRALADPGDSTLLVAVLVGLFFGLDYEQLVQHATKWAPEGEARSRAPFSFTAEWEAPETAVEHALARLNHYWRLTRRQPADIAISTLVEDLGVLPFAAAGDLGESRAGALLFALDAVRAASLAGDASLAGALATLDAALDEDESEAPLEPGRSDVVRVMNLHKAKGLEAPVVILAMPFGDWSPPPTSRVVRDETGRALGYATVTERKGQNQVVTLAQPGDWDAHAAEEMRFARAEDERLLYVAATRAAQELIISSASNPNSPSPWRSFYDWLRHNTVQIALPQPGRVAREQLTATAGEIRAAIDETAARRHDHARPTYRVAAVTDRKGEVALEEGAAAGGWAAGGTDAAHSRGTEWGTAVHDALQAASRGITGEELRSALRNVLIGLDRPIGTGGEPAELDELVATVEAVQRSAVWQRAHAAQHTLVEVPFAVRFTAEEYARAIGTIAGDGAPAHEIVDGRIDLIFRESDGWVVVDYKSDAAGERIPADLLRRYRGQLALYAFAWERLTGERVKEKALLFTATGILV